MLFDPARHEPLQAPAWDEARARAAIHAIASDTEQRLGSAYWPLHPLDAEGRETSPAYPLYHGACGVLWGLRYLEAVGAVSLGRSYDRLVEPLLALTRTWLAPYGPSQFGSYLLGETGILLLSYWSDPSEATARVLEQRILGNMENPTRELMWGSPGTMLVALFLYELTSDIRWAALFRQTARKLWSQLLWSDAHQCHYWTQDMYGETSTYLDAVHGFVATAVPLIRGRGLLEAQEWADWEQCIINTVSRSATREGPLANWRAWLHPPDNSRMLLQFCHGSPGFVVCLSGMPAAELDELLIAGGEATWAAGPLRKGSNLCHGTGGNGYAFLKLFNRTNDSLWLERARAFAMHGIAQTEAHAARYGQLRYSLWTGDPGFAIYLWDCIRGKAAFPTLDVFVP